MDQRDKPLLAIEDVDDYERFEQWQKELYDSKTPPVSDEDIDTADSSPKRRKVRDFSNQFFRIGFSVLFSNLPALGLRDYPQRRRHPSPADVR